MKKFLYLTLEGTNSSVFNSQVYELMNSKLNEEFDTTTVCFQPVNIKWNKVKVRKLREFIADKRIRKIIVPYIGFKGNFSLFQATLIFYLISLIVSLKNKEVIYHCRGQEASFIGLKMVRFFKNSKALLDIRGIPSEEYKTINESRSLYFKNLDNKIFSDKSFGQNRVFFNFVSNRMKSYYENAYNQVISNAKTIPCFSSFTGISNLNREDNEITFLYVGGQQEYQQLNKFGELIKVLGKENTKWIFCLNGGKNLKLEQILQKKATEAKANICFYYNCDSKELEQIYQKSDIGIIIRKDVILNNVASPVKLSEYLSKGLFLLLIGSVGDFNNYISKNPALGFSHESIQGLNPDKFIEKFSKEKQNYKKRISFSKMFSKEACIKQYADFYKII